MISGFPGFIEQRLMPPNPPLQVDWVILQRFASLEDAQALAGLARTAVPHRGRRPDAGRARRRSYRARRRQRGAHRAGLGGDQHAGQARHGGAITCSWEQKVAAAQSKAAGLQGYRFEPAVPGVQEDFVAILRFDSEANLQAWLDSPQRRQLIDEAAPLTAEFHTRMAQSGFEQWFRDATPPGAPPPAAWKMNMIVLLTLYPVVFLWGLWVGTPILTGC